MKTSTSQQCHQSAKTLSNPAKIWGHQKCQIDPILPKFGPFLGPKNPIKLGKKRQNAKSTLFYPPTGYSYDTENQWLSFDALKVVLHHPIHTWKIGSPDSTRLGLPSKGRLSYLLYEPLPAKMRRLTTHSHVMSLTPESERVQETLANGRADQPHYHHRSYAALISHLMENDEHLWTNIPVPSIDAQMTPTC